MSANNADVIVIGAGASGLKAATELVSLGRSVVVLEANERVGGRLKRGEVAGHVADFGGQWVGKGHDVLLAEARRLGVETYPQYESGKTVMQLLGKRVTFTGTVPRMPFLSLLELARIQKRWDRDGATVPAQAPWDAPRAELWDSITLDTWIEKNVHTKAARAFARLVPRGAWATDANQISYLWFLDALRSNGGLEYFMGVKDGMLDAKFKGGMQQIAQRLADALGDRLVLGAPALKIAQNDDGVRVTTPKSEFTARFAIVTAPPAAAARIAYEPHLPSLRDGLHQRMPAGSIMKIMIVYATPFWREDGLSGQVATDDDTLGLVFDDVRDDGAGVLLAFIEGRHAIELSAAGKEVRREKVIASLVRFFGPAATDYVAYDDNDWTLEPYAHGYVSSMPPGTMTHFGRALREPCGRIHWAGSETSEEFAGCIEGAMRSGLRAAHEVAKRHNA
jgi:monoamine oxidase